jgi:vacuolar-type H+-ATPase subunit F/Vma7
MAYKIYDNVVGVRDATAEETIQIDADRKAEPSQATKKLAEIKKIRLIKLKETDYLALSDTTLSVDMSNYRQVLRDIPQNNTTEDEYDLILARDAQGNLTNAIWSKP